MDPENSLKAHPNFVKGVKVLSNEGDTVTWEQRAAFMGMHLRSMAKASLNRATNTIETRVIEGNGKGTITTRRLMEIPTGTEVHYT